jgi:polysaccharide biosynthesis/export protein
MKITHFLTSTLSCLLLLATPLAAAGQTEKPQVKNDAVKPQQGDAYRIRTNDQIEIRVYGQADLSGMLAVREDGNVRLNLLQTLVPVGGLTLEAAEAKIRNILAKDYLKDPRVSLQIARHAVMRVTVMGRVAQPRTLPIPSNTPITLVQAIGMAGGKSALGNLKKVFLKRGDQVKVFDVEEMVRSNNTQTVELQDGDIIDISEKLW